MASSSFFYALAFGLILSFIATRADFIGVCYGMNGDNLPSPKKVIEAYRYNKVEGIRLFAPNNEVFEALRGSNISVVIDVGIDIASLASDFSIAFQWVENNIQPYVNDVAFRYIVVGDNIIPGPQADKVFPAMQNLQAALVGSNLQGQIKVSTSISDKAFLSSYPPSSGRFSSEALDILRPIIDFLDSNNAPFLASVFPYYAYENNKRFISLDYAIFNSSNPVVYDGPLQYDNLFDAIVDAFHAAIEDVGFGSLKLVVAASGWPTEGSAAATLINSGTFVNKLMFHVGKGTPRRPGEFIETYIFSVLDENLKKPYGAVNHFGLLTNKLENKYL